MVLCGYVVIIFQSSESVSTTVTLQKNEKLFSITLHLGKDT